MKISQGRGGGGGGGDQANCRNAQGVRKTEKEVSDGLRVVHPYMDQDLPAAVYVWDVLVHSAC